MKIALIEVAHWHVPLYLAGFAKPGLDVVGVTDRTNSRGPALASRFGCPLYSSPDELLKAQEVDLAFVFGRHADMPGLADPFLRRNIPFSIEKPCATNLEDIRALHARARAAGTFVAVPLWSRLCDLLGALRGPSAGKNRFDHIAFRFIAGPPSRYPAAGAPWMLDPAIAGGGCLINLAAHLIDLALILLDEPVVAVSGFASNRCFGTPIEDYFLLSFATAGGATAVIETGYTFPITDSEQREFSFSMSSPDCYVRSMAGGIRVYDRAVTGRPPTGRDVPMRLDADVYYPLYVERVVEDVVSGRPPVAGLREAEEIMRIVEAGYRSARKGQTVPLA